MIELLSSPDAWASLLMLTVMEIVLGIDNIVFLTILVNRLPEEQRDGSRRIGLVLALGARLVLLFGINWVMELEEPLFEFLRPWSGKDLILFVGGLFLLYKATTEIYDNVERPDDDHHLPAAGKRKKGVLRMVLLQIVLLDIVFSLDSVITAVGTVDHIEIMIAAMVIAVGAMMVFAKPIGEFVDANPSVRVLALSFLVLIGAMLMIEGTGQHVGKGYIYAAMGFSLGVELLNLRRRKRADRVRDLPDTST